MKKYKKKLDKIKNIYTTLSEYLPEEIKFEYSTKINKLEEKIDKFDKDEIPVKVAFIGDYNAGKSTIINSIIGKEILPKGGLPTTSIPTHLKYGFEEKACLILNDGSIKKISYDDVLLLKHDNEESFIKKYGNIIDEISRIEIRCPIKAFTKLQIIDTPGFQTVDKKGDDKKTESALKEADVLLWVFDANVQKEDEKRKIEELSKTLSIPIIGIINKYDQKCNQKGIDPEIINYVKNEIFHGTVIPYSAKKVLNIQKEKAICACKLDQMKSLILDKGSDKVKLSVKREGDKTKINVVSKNDYNSYMFTHKSIWNKYYCKLLLEFEKIRDKSKKYTSRKVINEIILLNKEITVKTDELLENYKTLEKEFKKNIKQSLKEITDLKESYLNRIEIYSKNYKKVFKKMRNKYFNFTKNSKKWIVAFTREDFNIKNILKMFVDELDFESDVLVPLKEDLNIAVNQVDIGVKNFFDDNLEMLTKNYESLLNILSRYAYNIMLLFTWRLHSNDAKKIIKRDELEEYIEICLDEYIEEEYLFEWMKKNLGSFFDNVIRQLEVSEENDLNKNKDRLKQLRRIKKEIIKLNH